MFAIPFFTPEGLTAFAVTALVITAVSILRRERQFVAAPKSLKKMEVPNNSVNDLAMHHPEPIWVRARNGAILWKNHASEAYCSDLNQIDTDSDDRTKLTDENENSHWFDLKHIKQYDQTVFYATSADAAIHQEKSRKEFIQTLAKTFAQLSTGLAIFDRNRCMALFNPSLLELTGLSFEVLSKKPSLTTFLDHMREKGMLPEPKDYKEWRDQISELETAAINGTYSALWELPTGQTYKVSGRPHPDGAIAILIEDISAEISLTRRFNNELCEYRSIIDSIENPIAVFSETGALTTTNQAYCDYWEQDVDASLSETSVIDCIQHWQSTTYPDPAWGDIRDFVVHMENRASWSSYIHLKNGSDLFMRCIPIPGNKSLIEFVPETFTQNHVEPKKMRAVF